MCLRKFLHCKMSAANGFQQRHPQQPQQMHSPKHQMQQHHVAPTRVFELIDALKHEVEGLYEESKFSKHHRKDLEQKSF